MESHENDNKSFFHGEVVEKIKSEQIGFYFLSILTSFLENIWTKMVNKTAFQHGIGYNYQIFIFELILFWKSNWKMMIKNIYNEILQIYKKFGSYNSGSTVHYISKALPVIHKKTIH